MRSALLCLILYGHVYVFPTLGSGNLEDSDHNAEMLKVILLAKSNGATLQSVQAGASVRFCVCARVYMGGAGRFTCLA